MTGRDAVLTAFDELLDAALARLGGTATQDERAEAREQFATRFAPLLERTGHLELRRVPPEVLDEMKAAIGRLSVVDVAGLLATVPLAQQTHEMLRRSAVAQAQQRLLEQLAMQADTRFGGN